MEEVVVEEIQRLNSGRALRAPINLAIVAETLSQLDGATTFGILEELMAQAKTVKNPTAWVCEAAEAALEEPFSPDDEAEDDEFRKHVLAPPRGPSHEELEATLAAPPAKMRRLASSGVPAGTAPLTPGAPAPPAVRVGKGAGNPFDDRPRKGKPSEGGPPQGAAMVCKAGMKGKGKLKGKLPANYKSEMCRSFARGHCAAGDDCNWAHSEEEYQAAKQRQLASLNRQLRNFRTSICQHYLAGKCFRGETCSFAHGEEELQGIDGAELPRTPPPAEEEAEVEVEVEEEEELEEEEFEECFAAAPQTPPSP